MKIKEGLILRLGDNYFCIKQVSIKGTKLKVLHSFRNKEIIVKTSKLENAELVTQYKNFERAKTSDEWLNIVTKSFKQLPKEKIEEARCIKRYIDSNPIKSKYVDDKIHSAVENFILENCCDEEE